MICSQFILSMRIRTCTNYLQFCASMNRMRWSMSVFITLIVYWFYSFLLKQRKNILKYVLQLLSMPHVLAFVKYVYLLYFNFYLDGKQIRKIFLEFTIPLENCVNVTFTCLRTNSIYWKIFYVNSSPILVFMSADKISSIAFKRFSSRKGSHSASERHCRNEKNELMHQFYITCTQNFLRPLNIF